MVVLHSLELLLKLLFVLLVLKNTVFQVLDLRKQLLLVNLRILLKIIGVFQLNFALRQHLLHFFQFYF